MSQAASRPAPGPPQAPPTPALAVAGRALARHAPALLAAAGGLAFIVLHVGWSFLDPTRVGWTLHRDWAAGQLGWSFFRSAPWGFPLGANPAYPYGIGSTVGFADGLPLLAVVLKPLAGLLPVDFQYQGPWIALCFAAQGFAGAKLTALTTPSRLAQALGGLLFACSPVLLHRLLDDQLGHLAAGAQALLLTLLWLALAPVEAVRLWRRLGAALAVLVLAGGINPYFVAMGTPLVLALLVRLAAVERRLGARAAAAWGVATVAAAALGLWLFGYLDPAVRTLAPGFGYFSADLLALVNPMRWSRLWPALPAGPGQYEGFGFVGSGVLLLGAIGLAASARRAWRREPGALPGAALRSALPVLVVALALFAFALASPVTLAGREVLELQAAYQLIPFLGDNFRSSGRFVWVLHHLATLGAIAGAALATRERPRLLPALLAAAVLVQAAELRPPSPHAMAWGDAPPAHSPAWQLARGHYRHLSRWPVFLQAGGNLVAPQRKACGLPPWDWESWIGPADLAYRLGLTYDGGYLGRLDERRAAEVCGQTRRAIRSGRLDPDTIYLLHTSELRWFRAAGATCGVLDDMPVCVAGDRADPFALALPPKNFSSTRYAASPSGAW